MLSKKLSMYRPLKYLPRGYLVKICNKKSREEAEPVRTTAQSMMSPFKKYLNSATRKSYRAILLIRLCH